MNNELFNHQKSDAVKWVCTLLAFLIVGVLIAGIICGWFDKKETPPTEQTETDHSARYGIATCKLVGRVEKRQFCVGYGQDGNGLCNDNARGRGRAHGYACLRKALFGTGDTDSERSGQCG